MRIRTLKPEFWESQSNSRLSRDSRLVFIGLLNLADDSGRIGGNWRRVAAALFPYDCDALEATKRSIDELCESGKITLYTVDGLDFIEVKNFNKHQKIDRRYPSKLPAPPIPAERPPIAAENTPTDQVSGNREQVSGNGLNTLSTSSKKSTEVLFQLEPVEDKGTTDAKTVFEFWKQTFARRKDTAFDAKRRGAVERQLKNGFSVEDLKQAIVGCSKTPHNMGKNDRGEKYVDLELICRDAAHVERFIANAKAPPVGNYRSGTVYAEDMGWTKDGSSHDATF